MNLFCDMLKSIIPYSFFLAILFLASCDKKEAPNWSINIEEWKLDKNACENLRSGSIDEVIDNKNHFLNWPERQISNYFGRPDRHRLSKRHQKFYVYFLETGRQCDESKSEFGRFIQFRIDATGYVNEIEIKNTFEQLTD